MRLTIISEDKLISIDGASLIGIEQDLSWIPSDVHVLQWYDTWGEVEYNNGTPNERIEELGIYEQAIQNYNDELERIKNLRQEAESKINYWDIFRGIRNTKLTESDWTQIEDAALTEEKKILWKTYRQELRDLPEIINDPKSLVLDENHSDWPVKPS